MSDRRWTYRQITTRSEERIATFIRLGKEAAAEEDGRAVAQRFSSQAEGVFEAWCAIVGGERRDDDTQRLRDHLDSIKPAIE